VGKFSFPPMPRQESLGHDSGVVVSDSPSPSTGLSQLQIWPVGFSPFGEIIVRDEGGELWDGVDGDSPILKVYHPTGNSLVEWTIGLMIPFLILLIGLMVTKRIRLYCC
jgi:hypothetical protein